MSEFKMTISYRQTVSGDSVLDGFHLFVDGGYSHMKEYKAMIKAIIAFTNRVEEIEKVNGPGSAAKIRI